MLVSKHLTSPICPVVGRGLRGKKVYFVRSTGCFCQSFFYFWSARMNWLFVSCQKLSDLGWAAVKHSIIAIPPISTWVVSIRWWRWLTGSWGEDHSEVEMAMVMMAVEGGGIIVMMVPPISIFLIIIRWWRIRQLLLWWWELVTSNWYDRMPWHDID